ncbi:MAG: hypothetical protein NT049_16140 [Planctomycetota bacterium]|nr:hypothetical protein [Planctomycetota bacterium]
MTEASSETSKGVFRAGFGPQFESGGQFGFVHYYGTVEVGPDLIRGEGIPDTGRYAPVGMVVGGVVGAVVGAIVAKRESENVHRFEVDPRRGNAVCDVQLRRFALEQVDGRWVTISLSQDVVGTACDHEFPVFLAVVRRLYGDRMSETRIDPPAEGGPSKATAVAMVIFFLAILAAVVYIVVKLCRQS